MTYKAANGIIIFCGKEAPSVLCRKPLLKLICHRKRQIRPDIIGPFGNLKGKVPDLTADHFDALYRYSLIVPLRVDCDLPLIDSKGRVTIEHGRVDVGSGNRLCNRSSDPVIPGGFTCTDIVLAVKIVVINKPGVNRFLEGTRIAGIAAVVAHLENVSFHINLLIQYFLLHFIFNVAAVQVSDSPQVNMVTRERLLTYLSSLSSSVLVTPVRFSSSSLSFPSM